MKRRGRGTYDIDKPPIFTIVSRKTKYTILEVVQNLSKKFVHEKIEKHCESSLIVYTDEFTIYHRLQENSKVKKHFSVNHSDKEYVNGFIHVNNAENRHSLIRPFLRIFRGISKKNLQEYILLIQYKINYKEDAHQKILETILT